MARRKGKGRRGKRGGKARINTTMESPFGRKGRKRGRKGRR